MTQLIERNKERKKINKNNKNLLNNLLTLEKYGCAELLSRAKFLRNIIYKLVKDGCVFFPSFQVHLFLFLFVIYKMFLAVMGFPALYRAYEASYLVEELFQELQRDNLASYSGTKQPLAHNNLYRESFSAVSCKPDCITSTATFQYCVFVGYHHC